MNTLYFHNPGEIDIRGATIAGLSAKVDETAIGFFGTGLKYGIACILRWGGTITIWSGTREYHFHAQDLDFRGKAFQQIIMTEIVNDGRGIDQPLGFTTEYGKQWVPWQVFREFYANALDEGGGVAMDTFYGDQPNTTSVIINCPQLAEEFARRDEIILPEQGWTYELEKAKVKDAAARHIYYKGVRVSDFLCCHTWNFMSSLELTEDRTLASIYKAKRLGADTVMQAVDKSFITAALNAPDGYFEASFDFPTWQPVSTEFLDVAVALYQQNPRKWASRLKELIEHHRPKDAAEKPFVLSPIQQKMLDRAIVLVERMGMPEVRQVTINLIDYGKDKMGESKNGEVTLCPPAFRLGTKQLVATLYEEMLHHTTGLTDCNYEMQNFLFDKIVSLYEEHVFKEPA